MRSLQKPGRRREGPQRAPSPNRPVPGHRFAAAPWTGELGSCQARPPGNRPPSSQRLRPRRPRPAALGIPCRNLRHSTVPKHPIEWVWQRSSGSCRGSPRNQPKWTKGIRGHGRVADATSRYFGRFEARQPRKRSHFCRSVTFRTGAQSTI